MKQACPGMTPSGGEIPAGSRPPSGMPFTPQGEMFSKAFSNVCNLETGRFMNMESKHGKTLIRVILEFGTPKHSHLCLVAR